VRKASVNLVREYLTCIDELTTLSVIFKNTKDLLSRLSDQLGDVLKGENSMTPDNENGESASSRVAWATHQIDDQLADAREMLLDLQESLTALFQLRSIEQNELAIVADSQNKAILVFTGVTIVFLPLSFFTSYFGMNLQGIVDTHKTEKYFWKLCGSLGFVLFFGIALYAFKHKLRARAEMIRNARMRSKDAHAV
jgi:Mg2+ and Co2+ transporter CorA